MSWLAGLGTISGPRWSCAAYWAEDGDPQEDDTDWGAAATWDAAHTYDPDAALSAGVFLAGDDVTDLVHSASWGLGQSDPMPSGVTPSSCTVSLKSSADPTIGDRLVILTEWDTLWSGRVEAHSAIEAPDLTMAGALVQLTATDELARASLTDVDDRILGGDVVSLAVELLARAGVVAPTVGEAEWSWVYSAARSGTILGVLSELLHQVLSQAAWTPAGLRIHTLELLYLEAEVTEGEHLLSLPDLEDFDTLTRSRSIERVITEATVSDDTPYTVTFDYEDSQEAYGIRPWSIETTDWYDASFLDDLWDGIIEGVPGTASHTEPLRLLTGTAKIATKRHRIARLLPYDQLIDGVDAFYRVMRTSHQVTADTWAVTIEAHEVRRDGAWEPVEFNGVEVAFNGDLVYIWIPD